MSPQPEPFNSQRGVSCIPRNTRGGDGFHAFEEQRRKEEALAHDEHLTAQERYRRYSSGEEKMRSRGKRH